MGFNLDRVLSNIVQELVKVFPSKDSHKANLILDIIAFIGVLVLANSDVLKNVTGNDLRDVVLLIIILFLLVLSFSIWCLRTYIVRE